MSVLKPNRLPRWFSLVVFTFVMFLFPFFSPNPYITTVMAFAGINILLCTGLNLLLGYAGQISFGHAAFWGLGAYVYGILTAKFAWAPVLSLFAAIFFTCLSALAIGIPTLRLRGHYLAVGTLGVGIILQIFFIQLDSLTGGPSGLIKIASFSVGGLVFDTPLKSHYLIWSWVFLGLLGALNLADSRMGRAMRAIKESEVAAETMGVKTFKYKLIIFTLTAGYASVAGVLYAQYLNFAAPETFGLMNSVLLLAMVVVGGIGSFWGPVVGALILTFLPEYLRAYEGLEVLLYGVILAGVMMFIPKGFAPIVKSLPIYLRRIGKR